MHMGTYIIEKYILGMQYNKRENLQLRSELNREQNNFLTQYLVHQAYYSKNI